MTYLPYDKTDEKSIEAYAKRLIGHTFLDVLEDNIAPTSSVIAEQAAEYGDKKRKGGLGNLLEEQYFKYR